MVNVIQPATVIALNEGTPANPASIKMIAKAILKCRPNSQPFSERTLMLDQPVLVGRSVARVKPSNTNAIFDCKVLSRNHALLWYEEGKFLLKDTKSSNGTFVNNQRLSKNAKESLPREISSGDILQFGVDVQTDSKEGEKHVTHGCIVATVKLFLPDGEESKASSASRSISLTGDVCKVTPQELYQLQNFIQEAHYREKLVQDKLKSLEVLLATTQEAMTKSWNKMFDEETMLRRFEILEAKLAIYAKGVLVRKVSDLVGLETSLDDEHYEDDELRQELIRLQEEKGEFEAASKQKIYDILSEKHRTVSNFSEMERTYNFNNQELGHMKELTESFKKEEAQLIDKISKQAEEIEDLTQKLKLSEHLKKMSDPIDGAFQSQAFTDNIKMASELETLKAENESTKEELHAMKSKYENLKNSATLKAISDCNNEELAIAEHEVKGSYDTLQSAVVSIQIWFHNFRTCMGQDKKKLSELNNIINSAETEGNKFKSLKETLEGFRIKQQISSESNLNIKKELQQQLRELEEDLIEVNKRLKYPDEWSNTIKAKKINENDKCDELKDKENNEMIIQIQNTTEEESTVDSKINDLTVNGDEVDPFRDLKSYLQLRINKLKAAVSICEKSENESKIEREDIEADLSKYTLNWKNAHCKLTDIKSQIEKIEWILILKTSYFDAIKPIKEQMEKADPIVFKHLCSLRTQCLREREYSMNMRKDYLELEKKLQEAESISNEACKEGENLKLQLEELKQDVALGETRKIDDALREAEKDEQLEAMQQKLVTITKAYDELKESHVLTDITKPDQSSFDTLNDELSTLLKEHEKLKQELKSRDDNLSDLALQNQIVLPTWVMLIALLIVLCWNGLYSLV